MLKFSVRRVAPATVLLLTAVACTPDLGELTSDTTAPPADARVDAVAKADSASAKETGIEESADDAGAQPDAVIADDVSEEVDIDSGAVVATDANDTDTVADAGLDSVASDAPPCSGSAISFTGGYGRTLNVANSDFTLEAWIKTTNTSRTGSYFWEGDGLLWADVIGSYNDFGVTVLNNKLAFGVGPNDYTIISTATVVTGAWTHIAVTRDHLTTRDAVYVNGVLSAAGLSGNTSPLSASAYLFIGANPVDSPPRTYTGLIDQVIVWNVVRTEPQVLADMQASPAPRTPGVQSYYAFDQPGTTIPDRAGNNSAMLLGAYAWVPSTRCGVVSDAAIPEAGPATVDAGAPDAQSDVQSAESGAVDAGVADAAVTDARAADVAVTDAGVADVTDARASDATGN